MKFYLYSYHLLHSVKLFFPPLFLLIFCRWHVSSLSLVFISSVSLCCFLLSYNHPLPLAFLLLSRLIYVGLLRVRNRHGNFVREWLASFWLVKCCPNNRNQEMQEWCRSWYDVCRFQQLDQVWHVALLIVQLLFAWSCIIYSIRLIYFHSVQFLSLFLLSYVLPIVIDVYFFLSDIYFYFIVLFFYFSQPMTSLPNFTYKIFIFSYLFAQFSL